MSANLQSITRVHRTWDNPKKIGHNTLAWNDGKDWAVRYHSTVVCQWNDADKTLFINTSGWFTSTTLQRIRHALEHVNLKLSTHDLKGKWRVMDWKGNAWTIRSNSLKLRWVDEIWVRVE